MRAVLDPEAGLRTGRRLTHVFHMMWPNSERELLISDAAVNVHPDFKTKLDIVRNAVELAHLLGKSEPKVALLSATEEATDRVPSSVEAARLAAHFAHAPPELRCRIYGPLALDVAISVEAARLKEVADPVAGNADVLIVPNIETGNALFKMMVHFLHATAAGVVLGAAVPIMLTSRADPPEARLASAAVACLAAKRRQGRPAVPAESTALSYT
jgi:phosphate acetyltransferase